MTRDRVRSRRRRGESFWRRTLMAQHHSDLSQAEFCRRNDLALSTFQSWRRRLRDESMEAETESDAQAPAFVELVAAAPATVPATAGRFELTFPNGLQLTVPTGVEGRALAEILWALQATDAC